MRRYKFIFTYSVSPNGEEERQTRLADKVRKKIAEIDKIGWKKLDNVETTFAGDITLNSLEASKKRDEAKSIVEKKIRSVIDEHDAYRDIWVDIALMIDGLGEHMDIRI